MLTGLLNRRAMLEQLERQSSEQSGAAFPCVWPCLIWTTSSASTTSRHAMGDRVLQTFARVARDEVRGGDVLARWGVKSSCS